MMPFLRVWRRPAQPARSTRRGLATAFAALLAASPALAQSYAITPENTRIEYDVRVFGLMPVQADFTHFTGAVSADLGSGGSCSVQLGIAVASLQSSSAWAQRVTLGPAMLNAAQFPEARFTGGCAGGRIDGMMTLRGRSVPVSFRLSGGAAHIIGDATVPRAAFGMTGFAGIVSRNVHIRVVFSRPVLAGR